MAGRPRNPDREKAFELWRNSGGNAKLKDIANELGIPDSRIRKWKTEDNWEERIKERSDINKGALLNAKGSATSKRGAPKGNINAKGHGAPRGNKNAVGNRGGPGGPYGNKKGVTTGEYEIIWWDCLTEEEQSLCNAINTDTLTQVEEDIRLLTVRERRMMERIRELMDGLTEKERKVLRELQTQKMPVTIYDEKTASSKVVMVPESKLVITEITETECRAIDDILKVEEALTRVQDKKTRAIALKHSIEIAESIELEKLKISKARLLLDIEKAKGENKGNQHVDALRKKMAERKIKNGSA